MNSDNLSLTFDLDWCNDEVLSYLLDKLIPNSVPATFFITHDTKLLHTIRKYDFFELGIHPNFNNGSSHGDNYKDVIDYCLNIVPEAISSRSHGLSISSNILIYMMERGIKIDSSILMPNINQMIKFNFEINGLKLIRCPYNWEDDYEFYQLNKKYSLQSIRNMTHKILDFHPIHIFLNSSTNESYIEYKKTGNILKNSLLGSESMLEDIIEAYSNKKINIYNLKSYMEIM
ncbi:polysaccharide deacetylase WbmS family protein [Campylobacter concisus]